MESGIARQVEILWFLTGIFVFNVLFYSGVDTYLRVALGAISMNEGGNG
jgi:hypothetical protein